MLKYSSGVTLTVAYTAGVVSIGSNKTGNYHDLKLQRWIELKPKTDIILFMDWGIVI